MLSRSLQQASCRPICAGLGQSCGAKTRIVKEFVPMADGSDQPLPRVVAFDGDDTLWHNETMFSTSQAEFRNVVTRHVELDLAHLDERLLATERRNLGVYGYGIKGFVLSMIETAIEVTDGRIPASDIEALMHLGRI